jgi:hypothetical protein
MTTKLSIREILLVLLLPAILIVCVYVYGFERRWSTQITALDDRIATARKNAVPPDREKAKTLEIEKLNKDLENETNLSKATTRPSLAIPSPWTKPVDRIVILERVAKIMEARSLYVHKAVPLSESEGQNIPPKPLQDLTAAVIREGTLPVPEVWRIEAMGTFADFLAALWDLGRVDGFIIPLAVSMDSAEEDIKQRKWSLWIWV